MQGGRGGGSEGWQGRGVLAVAGACQRAEWRGREERQPRGAVSAGPSCHSSVPVPHRGPFSRPHTPPAPAPPRPWTLMFWWPKD